MKILKIKIDFTYAHRNSMNENRFHHTLYVYYYKFVIGDCNMTNTWIKNKTILSKK